MTRPAELRGGLRQGFSLAELLVAILVLVIGVTAMAGVAAPIRRLQLQSQMQIEMSYIAQSKLEELRGLAEGKQFGTELSLGGSLETAMAGYSEDAVGQETRTYNVRWLIADGPSQTFELTVRVVPTTGSNYDPAPMDFQTIVVDR